VLQNAHRTGRIAVPACFTLGSFSLSLAEYSESSTAMKKTNAANTEAKAVITEIVDGDEPLYSWKKELELEQLKVELEQLNATLDAERKAELSDRLALGDRILDSFDAAGLVPLDPYTGDLDCLAYRCRAQGHESSLALSVQGVPLDGPLGCIVCQSEQKESEFCERLLELRGAAYDSGWDRAKADIAVISKLQQCRSIAALPKKEKAALAELEDLYRPLVELAAEKARLAELADLTRIRTRCGCNSDRPGALYYVRFDTSDGPLWKIGITARSVADRFSGEPTPRETIWERWFEDGSIPPTLERRIIHQYRHLQYKGSILRNGNTECFTADIFNGADIESIVERFDAAG
jgi:hypothetical protein